MAWTAGRIAERWALADLRRSAQTTLGLQIGALRAEMQRQSALPLALAADPEIAALLAPAPAVGLTERVNERLAQLAAATGAAVIYVVGADGVTVAASNAAEARSFIGQNYAFRPYFRRALAEGSGSQFALGTISGRPGLYLTRRLPEARGVVVVKIEFDAVEAIWQAFVDDEEDVRRADPQSLGARRIRRRAVPGRRAGPGGDPRRSRGRRRQRRAPARTRRAALFERIARADPDLPVILITGHGDIPMAVGAMRDGAYDFLAKPYPADALVASVRRALDRRRLANEN